MRTARYRYGIVLLTLLAAATAGEPPPEPPAGDAWLRPLLEAAAPTFDRLPVIRSARLAVESDRHGIAAARADWYPSLVAASSFDQSVIDNRAPEPYPPNASPYTLAPPTMTQVMTGPPFDHRHDDTASASLGVDQQLPTGTTVSADASSTRTEFNDSVDGDQTNYVQRVAVGLDQELLRGRNRRVNLDPILDAKDAMADDCDRLADLREERFAALCRDWIALARSAARVRLAATRVAQARRDRDHAQLLAEQQVDTKSVLSRQRDLLQQEARLRSAERALASARERWAIAWPGIEPPGVGAVDYAGGWRPAEVVYGETWPGRIRRRGIDGMLRQEQVLRDAAMDQLTLSAHFGLEGEHRDYSKAWRVLGYHRDYDWGVGLTWRHRLGGNRSQHELRALLLDIRAAQQDLVQADRDWQGQRETLSLAWRDSREAITDAEAILAALRKETEVLEAEAEGGVIQVRELLRMKDQTRNAEQALEDARFDAMRAEIDLRAHLDRLPTPTVPATDEGNRP